MEQAGELAPYEEPAPPDLRLPAGYAVGDREDIVAKDRQHAAAEDRAGNAAE
jgi:hypothetical protein